jgi:hypothetical protein
MKGRRDEATVRARIDGLDWHEAESSLARLGYARFPHALLDAAECRALSSLYAEDRLFRSRIDMARHRFGEGEYKYFAGPLPPIVEGLRQFLYPRLAKIANDWMAKLGEARRYPPRLDGFLAQCAARGQTRPTPLLLRYRPGGYNCLHQDLYGEVAFPLQAMIPLSRPGADYTGGEFLLVEQRPRAQSVATAIVPGRGDLVIFPNRIRPVEGSRGWYRANVRHGASRILSGSRDALAIIFHDAA